MRPARYHTVMTIKVAFISTDGGGLLTVRHVSSQNWFQWETLWFGIVPEPWQAP